MFVTSRRRLFAVLVSTTAAALAVTGLSACTQTVSGRPGPAPTVSGSGDFSPTSSSSDEPTDEPSESDTAEPTAEPSETASDEPTDLPTDLPTGDSTAVPGSPESLCEELQIAVEVGQGTDAATVRSYVSTFIFLWGLQNNDEDPFATVDAVTTQACPDTRSQILAIAQVPDLASTENG